MKRRLLAIALSCWMPAITQAQQPNASKPVVFVGPQMRGGFADLDRGVRDSIHDIQDELLRGRGIRVAAQAEDATLLLIVVGRGRILQGSVGFSSGSTFNGTGSGFGFVVPNTVPTLTTVLQVGAIYEKPAQTEGPTWTAVAKNVVEDLLIWWEANAAQVRNTKP